MKHKYTLIALLLMLIGGGVFHSQSAAFAQDIKPGDTTIKSDQPKPDVTNDTQNKLFKLADLPIIGTLFRTQQSNPDGSSSTLFTTPVLNQYTNSEDWESLFGEPSSPDVRVSPDVNNQNIRDAIKHIIGKADVTFEIDADVPTDTKVSLKASNITLTTALNALMEAADIGCKESTKRSVSDANGKRTVTVQMHYHFLKKSTRPLSRASAPYFFNSDGWFANNRFKDWNPDGNTRQFFAPDSKQKTQKTDPNQKPGAADKQDGSKPAPVGTPGPNDFSPTLQVNPKSHTFTPYFEINPKSPQDFSINLLNTLKDRTTIAPLNGPSVYNLITSEERSTFTCPHCKQQVTIIKKHVAPKCPTCGRVFQDDWKFCPADGSKRPEETGDWKFCPHCGKPVS